MNHPVPLFRALSSAWQHDAVAAEVDTLAAELSARVGASRYPLCLGLIRKEAVSTFYGLVYLLDGYGVTLRQRYRKGGDGVFFYAELKAPAPSDYAGAIVLEHRVTRLPETEHSTLRLPDFAEAA